MLSYLEKVEEKVKGVLEDGVSEGVERSRIEAVCPPFFVLDGMLIEVGVTSREKGSRKSAQSVPRTSLAPCLHSILPLSMSNEEPTMNASMRTNYINKITRSRRLAPSLDV